MDNALPHKQAILFVDDDTSNLEVLTYLRTIRETIVRVNEINKLKWADVDL